jgi:hypothetical protein
MARAVASARSALGRRSADGGGIAGGTLVSLPAFMPPTEGLSRWGWTTRLNGDRMSGGFWSAIKDGCQNGPFLLCRFCEADGWRWLW